MWRCATRSIVFVCLLSGSAPGQQVGLDPSRDLSQYAHRVWSKREGLPQNSVSAIAQTPDGYLWFGTMEGLARFDGSGFSTLNTRNTPELRINYILGLLVDRDSVLWVGTAGMGVVQVRKGEVKRPNVTPELDHAVVRQFTQSRDGDVWAASTVGLARFRGDSLIHLYTPADGLPADYVFSSTEDSSGRFYALTPKGIWIREGGCFEPYIGGAALKGASDKGKPGSGTHYRTGLVLEASPMAMICDRGGRLWIGTRDRGLYEYDGVSLTNYSEKDGLGPGPINVLYEDQRGTIWIGSGTSGLSRLVNGKGTYFTSSDGLSGDEVLSILEDREGVLWAGVATGGVDRFLNSKFTTFQTGQNAADNMVWALFADSQGRLIATTATGKITEFRNGAFVPSAIVPGGSPAAVRAAASRMEAGGIIFAFLRDRAGARWVGGADGVQRYDGNGLRKFPVGLTTALAEDRFGRIWASATDGLWCITGDQSRRAVSSKGDTPMRLRQVLIDNSGSLWIASRENGLTKYQLPPLAPNAPVLDETTALHITQSEGLSSNWVTTMVADSGGRLWVATFGGGLNIVQGTQVASLTSTHGLPEEGLMGIALDGLGSLWLSSNNGIHRIALSDMYAYLDGRRSSVTFQSFGISDGMYSDECNGGFQSCVARTSDGKLWFPTTSGVVMVDPAHLPTNTVPPAIVLERVRIDNLEGVPLAGTEYPPGKGDLEFQFAGLSSNAPERIRFRYMLEGFNKDWIDAGNRHEVFYTNILPGTYRFRVIACNADGVWNEAGIDFPFVLRPHFSQTAWFGVLVAFLVLSMVTGVWYLYKRDRDRELQGSRLESQLAQAQLQILEMQLQPHFLFNTLNGIMVLIRQDPGMASRMIARLSEFLRLTLESAGQQEVTLRRELEYLNRYIQIEQLRFGERLTIHQRIGPDTLEALVPNLILQPRVENAIRHGVSKRRGPALISVEAVRENGSLTIHVRDNGGGLPETGSEGIREGIGLRNTRTRLHVLYGAAQEFDLAGQAGGGVDVRLTIPYHKESVV